MKIKNKIKQILSYYESDTPGTKANIYRVLTSGKLEGTGKVVILPVDQGFEHGPEHSFASNPEAYDPHYHFSLAIEAGLSAFAAPIGLLESGADTFAGQIPLILKINSGNSLMSESYEPDQSITGSIEDAIKLGCSAVGFTIYPSSDNSIPMYENIAELIREAKSCGLFTVIWSYPRGGDLSKEHETAVDVVSYAAHIAALLGAHFIKVKPPKNIIKSQKTKESLSAAGIQTETLAQRIEIIKKSAFNGRRIVIFSGGESKTEQEITEEISEIAKGGGDGSIIGRNAFQRPKNEAISLLDKVINIYQSTT